MKIAVIAANGRSGRAFVEVALSSGHQIIAGVRGDSKFTPNNALTVQQCDATNHDQVRKLVEGADAVVSMIGHVKGSDALVQTDAMKVIVRAMNDVSVKRLVSLTGTGARVNGDTPSLLDKILTLMISIIDPKRVNDGKEHVKVLQESDLDFTVIRVMKLTNGKAGTFSLTPHGPGKPFVSRHEVAAASLTVLENDTFVRQYPVVSL